MVGVDLRKACEETIAHLLRTPVQFRRERTRGQGDELKYRLLAGDSKAHVCVQLRNRFRPSELPQLIAQYADGCEHRMLFTDYITSSLAEQLRARGIWFADALGNAFMEIPGSLLLHTTGNRPERTPAPAGQHFSAPGGKILHYLLKHGPRIQATYRDIRGAIGVSIDKVGKLVRELEQSGSLRMRGSGDYEILNGDRLLALWAEAYRAKLMPMLLLGQYAAAPNLDFEALIQEAVRILDGQVVVGGEVAADVLTQHLRPQQLCLYVPEDRAADIRRSLKLAPSGSGTVELCNLYSLDIASERHVHGAAIADPAFVYAELMAGGDDRLAETALRLRQEFLSWTL